MGDHMHLFFAVRRTRDGQCAYSWLFDGKVGSSGRSVAGCATAVDAGLQPGETGRTCEAQGAAQQADRLALLAMPRTNAQVGARSRKAPHFKAWCQHLCAPATTTGTIAPVSDHAPPPQPLTVGHLAELSGVASGHRKVIEWISSPGMLSAPPSPDRSNFRAPGNNWQQPCIGASKMAKAVSRRRGRSSVARSPSAAHYDELNNAARKARREGTG